MIRLVILTTKLLQIPFNRHERLIQVSLTDIQSFTSHSVVIFGYFDVGHRNHNPLGLRQNRQGGMIP